MSGATREIIIRIKAENKKLKEALLRCSPMNVVGIHFNDVICKFCNSINQHKDDCEYVRLTRESEDL
jgi:hypothetical protein